MAAYAALCVLMVREKNKKTFKPIGKSEKKSKEKLIYSVI